MAARHKYRLQCQTINKQNKMPCKASGILMKNGNIRCRMHGGWSTGPKTPEGKAKALLNLKQNSNELNLKQNNDQKTRINSTDS